MVPMSELFEKFSKELLALKPTSKAFIASLLLTLILFIVYHWQMFFCSLILLLPSMRLLYWWYQNNMINNMIPIDYLLQSYAQGFWILMLFATGLGFISFLIGSLILFILLGSIFGFHNFLAWCWIFELARWSLFVFIEEISKASFVRADRLRRQQEVGSEARVHAISALALSLGYATSQAFIFMIIITSILANNGGYNAQREQKIKGSEFGWMIFWSLFFGIVSMPLNLMGTYLMGIAMTKSGEDNGGSCCFPACFPGRVSPHAPPGSDAPSSTGPARTPQHPPCTCCDCDYCGYPPGGCAGVWAFLAVLKWPLILRSILIAQFFCWVYWVPILWAFLCQIITISIIYYIAYQIVKQENDTPLEDDVYRLVYGFQLMDDNGDVPMLPIHQTPSSSSSSLTTVNTKPMDMTNSIPYSNQQAMSTTTTTLSNTMSPLVHDVDGGVVNSNNIVNDVNDVNDGSEEEEEEISLTSPGV